jgi:hypothetical protein
MYNARAVSRAGQSRFDNIVKHHHKWRAGSLLLLLALA